MHASCRTSARTWSIALALLLGSAGCKRTPERPTVAYEAGSDAGSHQSTSVREGSGAESDAAAAAPAVEDGSSGDAADSQSRGPDPGGAETDTSATTGEPVDTAGAAALAAAFIERLTVWRRHDGRRVLTPHCRNALVPCEDRLRAFAALIDEIAETHDVDPLLVAAIAFRESGLDPSALGRRREAGIIQLHPRGAGHDIRYVQDAAYRARCQRRVDACQREVLERGIAALARGIEECGGVRGGLGAYASGHCTTSIRYIERVLEERARMRRLVQQARADLNSTRPQRR